MADKLIIDFLPKRNAIDDMTKVRDTNDVRSNTVIISVLNIMTMMRGTLPDCPEMGGNEILLQLTNSDSVDVNNTCAELSAHISRFVKHIVTFTVKDGRNSDNKKVIEFTIGGIPGMVKSNLMITNDYVELVNPKYIYDK